MIEHLTRTEAAQYLKAWNDDIVRRSRHPKGQTMVDRLVPAVEHRQALAFRNTQDDSIVVVRPQTGQKLLIELMFSPKAGGLNRNWNVLMHICRVLEVRYLLCEAMTRGHALLYARLGFTGPDSNGLYSLKLNRGRHGRKSTNG